MSSYTAAWILPITGPPIAGGSISIDNGRITSVANGRVAGAVDLGRVAVMPSLVNAHTHLELSYLHSRVPPAPSFTEWVRPLMALRRQFPDPQDAVILGAADAAIAAARATGTGLFGDISNTLVTVPLLRAAGMPAHVFFELLGFSTPDPGARVDEALERVTAHGDDPECRVSLAPHAPYSVSPGLFAAIRRGIDSSPGAITSVHLGESGDEVELLATGAGPLRTLLEDLGAWNEAWQAPGVSPVSYLSELGFLDWRVLAVHGVQFSDDDLARVRSHGATVVSCPRSNAHVGAGAPPIGAFYASGVSVAFGTDSLASVEDLNIFSELAAARRLAPEVPAAALLESATLQGARALGFADVLGSITAGKRASLISVRLPERVDDVEEYLVSGVAAADITWLK